MAQPILAQKDTQHLSKADSLFARGQVEQAYPLYRLVQRHHRQYSPRQLLRLAYIQEQRNHFPAALYYLSLLYHHQPTLATWQKMTELAQANRLEGYRSSWQQELQLYAHRYYNRILQLLLTGAVGAGTVLLWRLAKRRRVARGWWGALAAYLLLTALVLNGLAPPLVGLVCRPQAAIMRGPGAGAGWVTVATAGDRLTVQGRRDIWYQVEWRGKTAYIRQQNLLLVE